MATLSLPISWDKRAKLNLAGLTYSRLTPRLAAEIWSEWNFTCNYSDPSLKLLILSRHSGRDCRSR